MPITSAQARLNASKGGRPKGSKGKATLIKEAAKNHFDKRVLKLNDRLINAQTSLAIGQTFLYKIEKEFIKTGENKDGSDKGYWKNLKPELVESQDEIESYLERLAENNGSLDDDSDESAAYYFLTTKEPDNKAIDSLRDRTFGKAKESLEITGEVKFSLKGLADRRKELLEEKDATIVEAKVKELFIEEAK